MRICFPDCSLPFPPLPCKAPVGPTPRCLAWQRTCLSALVGRLFAGVLRSLKPQHGPFVGRKAPVALGHLWHLDTGMGAWLGIPGGSTLAAKLTCHNDKANRGSPACPGAGHSAGLSVWGAGWWLWQAAGVRSLGSHPISVPSLLGNFG